MVLAFNLIVLALAAAPLLYYILAIYCTIDFFSRGRRLIAKRKSDFLPPVSILKPVRGVDREAYENFASFCNLDYPEYELLFGVADPSDPVVQIVRKLQHDFPKRRIRLIAPIPEIGTNRKVSTLYRLVAEAAHEWIVMSDSDVRVGTDYLRRIAAPFADTSVGGVTCFYRSRVPGSFAARLDGLGMAMESAPGALVAAKLEGKTRFAFGSTMATTKKHLAEIGGWEGMANHHSDDFELGNRLAAAGYRVELLADPVEIIFPREGLKEFLHHELRWSIGLRNVRPVAYWGMLLTHGLPWSLLAALLIIAAGWPKVLALTYVLGYLTLRLGGTWIAGVWGLRDSFVRKNLRLVPLRDAITFCVWLAGCFRKEIRWRGSSYRVENRRLIPVNTVGTPEQ